MSGLSDSSNTRINPFLIWAGGKRWLVQSHKELFPNKFNKYFEPFLGGGSIYFALQPKKAVVSDKNKDLIETYIALQDDWQKVYRLLRKHIREHSKKYYYKVRNSRARAIYSRAARFIYLNHTCWNGLYRVNNNGDFNVPIGTRTDIYLNRSDFKQISDSLKETKIKSSDFEEIIDSAKENDFVFVDPPYTVKHDNNNFIKYNEELFSWDDQIRLKDSLLRAKKRGVLILATNANHKCVKDLYKDNFFTSTLSRFSGIAASSKNRQRCKELIIKSCS